MSPDGKTDFFKISAGVLQGDTLAHLLFILTFDYAMRKATSNPHQAGFNLHPHHNERNSYVRKADTNFAGDIALISETIEKAQLLLLRVETAAESVGSSWECYKKR